MLITLSCEVLWKLLLDVLTCEVPVGAMSVPDSEEMHP